MGLTAVKTRMIWRKYKEKCVKNRRRRLRIKYLKIASHPKITPKFLQNPSQNPQKYAQKPQTPRDQS